MNGNIKDIELKTTVIPPCAPRKMDFGKVTVCSNCGSAIFSPNFKCCGELMSLKKYVEEIRGVKFDNKKWSFEETTEYSSDEVKELCNKEIINIGDAINE